ncbi:MAG TPA: flagellar biosynthesis protein FlgH, partial [Gammaproteobacteria bacterium]|nr:flagellar biosynthesis protein FlgH [Gammaproteobacteria bacterium]
YHQFRELPAYQPQPLVESSQGPATGSIYSASRNMVLFEDLRARQVGDVVTIKLVEKTSAKKDANSEVKKNNQSTVTNPTLLGTTPEFNVPGLVPLASNRNNNLGFDLSSDSNFKGEADADQSNSLSGDLTAVVTQVLANGNLVVRGEKIMTLNQGDERIGLVGEVRPADIGPDNVVLSTRVANAHIVYDGTGQVADASKMGWVARFFISALMPF